LALHKQEKAKKQHEPNFTLFPNFRDKFLIFLDKGLGVWKVTHYSRWGFRGKYTTTGQRSAPGAPWRRNDYTYVADFKNEIEAMQFAKDKATQRKFHDPVFLLQLDLDYVAPL